MRSKGGSEGALIAQIEFLERQFAQHIRIADAALRELNDCLGDKSRRRIITNFQMQRVAGRYEGGGHFLDGFRVKGLTSKKRSDRHDTCSQPHRRDSSLGRRL